MPRSNNVSTKRYSAPALDKGLDILELLAGAPDPMTASQITQALGRSINELFRMIQVLEERGFVERTSDDLRYRATDRLFKLGMEKVETRNLLEVALPVMRDLVTSIGQSCHLVIRSGRDMIAIARMESTEMIGFSVRIGYRKPLYETNSGAVLYAFQSDKDQKYWQDTLIDGPEEVVDDFVQQAAAIRERGYECRRSWFTEGITDISAPILRGPSAIAALTIPFVASTQLKVGVDTAVASLLDATQTINDQLIASDRQA